MLKNSVYNVAGGFFKLLVSIFAIPFLIEFIGINGYGLFAIASSIINFAALAENSISLSITVFISQRVKDKNLIQSVSVYIILIFAFFTSAILLIFSNYVEIFFDKFIISDLEQLKFSCRVGIVIIFSRFIHQFFIGIEQYHQKYGLSNFIGTMYTSLQVIGNVIIAWQYSSIVMIFVWQSFISVTFVLVHFFFCFKHNIFSLQEISFSWDFAMFKKFWKFSTKTLLSTLGSVLFTQGDKLIIGKILGTEIVGIYSGLTSIVYQINVLSALPAQPIIPIVSKHFTDKNSDSQLIINNSISKALFLNFILALGVGGGIILFAPEILSFIISFKHPLFNQSLEAFYILAVIYSIYSLNAVGYFILFSIHKESVNTIISISSGIFSIILIYYLSSTYKLIGVSIGNIGFITTLLLLWQGIKLIKYPVKKFFEIVITPVLLFGLTLLSIFMNQTLVYRLMLFAFLLITLLFIYQSKIKYYVFLLFKIKL